MKKSYLRCAPEVSEALSSNRAVVALESTIISHGMPYPKNVEMAIRVEEQIRQVGAVPATCAVYEGKWVVGLSADELAFFAKLGNQVPKASRRDLPILVSQRRHGATTVASTMIIAAAAGIEIFATGGIGGVHRGAETTMDISADLQELAQTSVGVVSAGVKSILDIGLTLEYLETHGVPVVGYQTDEFPAYFTRSSGFGVDVRLDTPAAVARMLFDKWNLGLHGGVLIANPVPEAYAADPQVVEPAIETALAEARQLGIKGKDITPFLLRKIVRLTRGHSLAANIELMLHNARVAAHIAIALAELKTKLLLN